MRAFVMFLIAAIAASLMGWFTSDRWLPTIKNRIAGTTESETAADERGVSASEEPSQIAKVSKHARKNLSLISKQIALQTYVRTIEIPGTIVDRPGRSDRGVTSPAVGIVTEVHAFPGDTVSPGDRLFSLRLFSEYLQSAQKELFSASRETEIAQEQITRLQGLAESGGVARSKLIELENEVRRQSALIQGHRQDLLTRGLSPTQVDAISDGNFVSTIDVVAPPAMTLPDDAALEGKPPMRLVSVRTGTVSYEVQDLEVELGQQVQAGQILSTLADHSSLLINGHAFKRESSSLEAAAQNAWPVDVRFSEDNADAWPELEQRFKIRHLSNSIDTVSRTFDFFIPLENQSRSYENAGQSFVVWRFRPGQRVRLRVPVEQMQNVFVLPAAAVVREGPEAYVFRQNGDLFNRISVHVVYEDRSDVIIANDGSIFPGQYFAQSSAASLNRVMKSQSASGMKPGLHVHADGSVHEAH